MDHLRKRAVVVKKRARSEIVRGEGLMLGVLLEERSLKGFNQRMLVDIRIGVVDECAWLAVSVRIDVQIEPSACDTAFHILPIIPEVHCEDWLCMPVFTDLVVHIFPVLSSCHEVGRSTYADRHVCEEPCELGTHIDHPVEILLGTDDLVVLMCIAAGHSEWKLMLLEDCHRLHNLVICSMASSGICCFAKALDGYSRDEVLHAEHILGEFIIDERSVRECHEL